MGTEPPHRPPSPSRRRLLLSAGVGAANLLALRSVNVGRPTAIEPAPSQAAPVPAGPTQVAAVTEPARLPPAITSSAETPAAGHVFDVVINGGRVIDPDSRFDGLANLGIDGATITAISTDRLAGSVEIDATARIVAPGFVDLLSYEPNSFGVWLKLADGVTTNLAMHGVNNYADAFFRRYENQTPIHYGGAFHHHFMRGFDIGAEIDRPLDAQQLTALEALTAANLGAGFGGICFSPEYSPGTTTEEMERLAAVAAGSGHTCFFHVRHSDPDPPGTSLEAIEEVLRLAETVGVSVHIEHLASTGGTFVMHEALALLNGARASGVDVTACLYPYDFWGTFLGSTRFSLGWQDRYRLAEEDLQIAGTSTTLTAATFGGALADNKLVAALGSIPEAEIQLALREPWMIVASDAIPTSGLNNHPRGAGTCARTIGRYVRELGVLDLVSALAKLTILPARRVERMIPAMARKGRLQQGADADVVVFDPETIGDRATVEDPGAPSVGIDHVLVDGQLALRDGEPDRSMLAGRPLRSAGLREA